MNFAFLSDGHTCTMGWGAVQQVSKPNKNSFYINDFDLAESNPFYVFEHYKECPLADARELLDFFAYLPLVSEWYLSDYEHFRYDFEEAKERFQEKTLTKALLSVCDFSGDVSTKLSSQLKRIPSFDHYFYGHCIEGKGAWGLSPELLLETEQNNLRTMALAGTYAKDKEPRHEPEHQEVISFFKEMAQEHSLEMQVSSPEEYNYAKIKHLKSEVLFKNVDISDIQEWVKRIHPTPALGVSPRNAGNMYFLKALRKTVPAHFGAPFGFCSQESTRLIVAIRGTFFDEKKAFRPIGVGVTAASSLESEWKEISLKRFAMEELCNQLT